MSRQKKIETLLNIRKQLLPILDIDFVINVDNPESDDWTGKQIARGIKGVSYRKEKEKIAKFARHHGKILKNLKTRVLRAKDEAGSLTKRLEQAYPGQPPKRASVDTGVSSDVLAYNEKARRFNNKLEIYRQLQAEKRKAEENHRDAVHEYKNKTAAFKEELVQKFEKLETALGSDIIICIGNLSRMVDRNIEQRKNLFESFVFIFLAKKLFYSLSEHITTIEKRIMADQILETLDCRLSKLIENHKDEITGSLLYGIDYFYHCSRENEKLLGKIESELRTVQHLVDSAESRKMIELISMPLDVKFEYRDVIDPDQLHSIERAVEKRKNRFQQTVGELKKYSGIMEPYFQKISGVERRCNRYLKKMGENKNCKLDKLFFDIPFISRIFAPEEQDELLWKCKGWLKSVQVEIEKKYNLNLDHFIENAVETGLLYNSTAQLLKENSTIAFLSYKPALQEKRAEAEQKIYQLDKITDDIQTLPQKKADEAGKELSIWLFLSIISFINIGVFFPFTRLIGEFLPVFSRGNASYNLLRKSLITKLQFFLFIHILLMLSSGALVFWAGETLKILFSFMTANYISSSVILGHYLKKITKISIKNTVHQEKKGG